MTDVTPAVARRQAIERRIVLKFLETLEENNRAFTLDDGGETLGPCTKAQEAIDRCFDCDDLRVLVKPGIAGFANVEGGRRAKLPGGWVYFVYGNDGWDVINDYAVNLEDLVKPALDLADAIENGTA